MARSELAAQMDAAVADLKAEHAKTMQSAEANATKTIEGLRAELAAKEDAIRDIEGQAQAASLKAGEEHAAALQGAKTAQLALQSDLDAAVKALALLKDEKAELAVTIEEQAAQQAEALRVMQQGKEQLLAQLEDLKDDLKHNAAGVANAAPRVGRATRSSARTRAQAAEPSAEVAEACEARTEADQRRVSFDAAAVGGDAASSQPPPDDVDDQSFGAADGFADESAEEEEEDLLGFDSGAGDYDAVDGQAAYEEEAPPDVAQEDELAATLGGLTPAEGRRRKGKRSYEPEAQHKYQTDGDDSAPQIRSNKAMRRRPSPSSQPPQSDKMVITKLFASSQRNDEVEEPLPAASSGETPAAAPAAKEAKSKTKAPPPKQVPARRAAKASKSRPASGKDVVKANKAAAALAPRAPKKGSKTTQQQQRKKRGSGGGGSKRPARQSATKRQSIGVKAKSKVSLNAGGDSDPYDISTLSMCDAFGF